MTIRKAMQELRRLDPDADWRATPDAIHYRPHGTRHWLHYGWRNEVIQGLHELNPDY